MADRISNLPDSLLYHILSFVPTKEAVATSILSKRWRPLWRNTPSFDFNDQHFAPNQQIRRNFLYFVEVFLVSLDDPIKRFRLNCVSNFTSKRCINKWVNAAIKRNVEHLEILKLPDRICLSSNIFTSESIVIMKLNNVNLEAISSVNLPSIKILLLHEVMFSESWCASKLISGCTFLENLVVSRIQCRDTIFCSIDKDLPKLISADVQDPFNPLIWSLLSVVSNVKFLRFKVAEYFYRDLIPIFHNLVHVEILFLYYYNWAFLAEIFQNSPVLQILILKKNNFDIANLRNQPVVAAGFLSPQLKKCYIGGFEGKESDLQFARYILENASLLTTFTISSYGSSEAKSRMLYIYPKYI